MRMRKDATLSGSMEVSTYFLVKDVLSLFILEMFAVSFFQEQRLEDHCTIFEDIGSERLLLFPFLMPFEFLLNHMLCLSLWCNINCWALPSHHLIKRKVGLLFNHLFCGVNTCYFIFMHTDQRHAWNSRGMLMVNCYGGFPCGIIHFIMLVKWRCLYLPTWQYFLFRLRRKVRGKNPTSSFLVLIWFAIVWQAFNSLLFGFVTLLLTPLAGTRSGTSLECVEWNNLNLISAVKNFTWHF